MPWIYGYLETFFSPTKSDDEVWQFKDKSSILIVDRLIVSFEITIKIFYYCPKDGTSIFQT